MRLLHKHIVIVLLGGALFGCSGSGDFGDLQAFMDEVDARPKGRIQPLPPFEQVPPFAYQASAFRSPFEPPVVLKPVDRTPGGVQVTPNFSRVKQFLEQYAIGNLAMVGTLARGGDVYALVRDSDGGVHRVESGDYLGTDHGQIRAIGESSIELVEIVPDGTGGWVQRARTVALGGDRG